MKAILLDIEGTTTPIDFVHKTLFPFAKAKMKDFVRDNFDAIRAEIARLESEFENDSDYNGDFDAASPESVAAYLEFLIEVDRKSTPLKSLQGKIWQAGYESGALRSEMFADVPRAFKRWREQGKTIAVYSSGSVLAQKLIFKYSNAGDLSESISAFFDTNVGHKRETASYEKIARELDLEADEILFVSDVLAELDAARGAGLQTALIIREGNVQIEEDFTHQSVTNFDELE